ncbi:MAG: DNA-3-methyladenine glycosylase I [Lachnospiraceae bacterium]|nr:DNA-3-methyladenine glycosylase I [Lachnospiraceae bacterium]
MFLHFDFHPYFSGKKRGFRYLGSGVVYSHLQACGRINDYAETCFRYKEVMKMNPWVH